MIKSMTGFASLTHEDERATFGEASTEYQQCLARQQRSGGFSTGTGGGSFGGFSTGGGGHK